MKQKSYIEIKINKNFLLTILLIIAIILCLYIFGLIISASYNHIYNLGYQKGFVNGQKNNSEWIFNETWNNVQFWGYVTLDYIDGRHLKLYKEQCPEYNHWAINPNLKFGVKK